MATITKGRFGVSCHHMMDQEVAMRCDRAPHIGTPAMAIRLTAFPYQNTKSRETWYGVPPSILPNAITLLNTGQSYYPNGWIDEQTGAYKYFLDRRACEGNDILSAAADRKTRVFIYERSSCMFCNFIGEFRVESIDCDTSQRKFARLQRQALPTDLRGVLAEHHQTLAVTKTPRFRSESERQHYKLLCSMASRVKHEEWPFTNVSYTWQGVEKTSDSIPDFTVYDDAHPSQFMVVESKSDAACRDTDENVQKLRALSTTLPPLFRFVLICGHGKSMEITEYINGVATPLTLDTLMSGPTLSPRVKRARHSLHMRQTAPASTQNHVITQEAT